MFSSSNRAQRIALLSVAFVAAAGLSACDDAPSKPKKAAMVKILPDTPPPPPPPKVEEKKPEPKEDKPQQQLNQPKQVEAPQPQALKSDEAAGDGPGNGMQSGAVSSDYAGGQIGQGAGEALANRFAFNNYANGLTRSLNDFLARDKDLKRRGYNVKVNVWLTADGRLERAELVGTTGDTDTDAALRTALGRFPGSSTPVPDKLPQPMRLLVTNRILG